MASTSVARASAGLIALALAMPASARDETDLVNAMRALAARDLRVATVAYRMQTAGAPYCPRRTRLPGLLVQDASQYAPDYRPTATAVFNLHDAPAVTGLVPGAPAGAAGLLPGDEIVSVNGESLLAEPGARPRDRTDRYTGIIRRLDAAYQRGPATLGVRRGGAIVARVVSGTPACASDVQLDLSGARQAAADGDTVTLSMGILDFVRSDDELAFVMGHELAHNILGHREFLDSTGTSRHGLFAGLGGNGARVRETERQADYLGLYLAAWAGYDYHAAADFWRRMGRADPLAAIFSDGTHPGGGERVRELQRGAAEIDARLGTRQPLVPDYEDFAAGR
jgi:hypothetical protein